MSILSVNHPVQRMVSHFPLRNSGDYEKVLAGLDALLRSHPLPQELTPRFRNRFNKLQGFLTDKKTELIASQIVRVYHKRVLAEFNGKTIQYAEAPITLATTPEEEILRQDLLTIDAGIDENLLQAVTPERKALLTQYAEVLATFVDEDIEIDSLLTCDEPTLRYLFTHVEGAKVLYRKLGSWNAILQLGSYRNSYIENNVKVVTLLNGGMSLQEIHLLHDNWGIERVDEGAVLRFYQLLNRPPLGQLLQEMEAPLFLFVLTDRAHLGGVETLLQSGRILWPGLLLALSHENAHELLTYAGEVQELLEHHTIDEILPHLKKYDMVYRQTPAAYQFLKTKNFTLTSFSSYSVEALQSIYRRPRGFVVLKKKGEALKLLQQGNASKRDLYLTYPKSVHSLLKAGVSIEVLHALKKEELENVLKFPTSIDAKLLSAWWISYPFLYMAKFFLWCWNLLPF